MRALGIDLGAKRIGVAISDSGGILATPLDVIERRGDQTDVHRRIVSLAEEEGAGVIVVGLPTDLAGRTGIAAGNVLTEVARLATVASVPVETYDERMTTAVALKQLREVKDRKKGVKDRKKRVDALAAAVILQGWLDSHGRVADG